MQIVIKEIIVTILNRTIKIKKILKLLIYKKLIIIMKKIIKLMNYLSYIKNNKWELLILIKKIFKKFLI